MLGMDFSILGRISIATAQLGGAKSSLGYLGGMYATLLCGQVPVQAGYESNTDHCGSRHREKFPARTVDRAYCYAASRTLFWLGVGTCRTLPFVIRSTLTLLDR
jgi:hypothetical protein